MVGSLRLRGSIPEAVSLWGSMRSLVISFNILSGSIPHGVGSMADLEYLGLSAQWLTGDLPGHLGSLAKMFALELRNNILSGYFPDWHWLRSMETCLVSHYSAIGDTISCNAPYSAKGFRGKIFLRWSAIPQETQCDRVLPHFRDRDKGGGGGNVPNTRGDPPLSRSPNTCLAIRISVGSLRRGLRLCGCKTMLSVAVFLIGSGQVCI